MLKTTLLVAAATLALADPSGGAGLTARWAAGR
jgi:hypothetical protein